MMESDAYLEFKIAGKTYNINVNDAAEDNVDGKKLYRFSCPVSAAQMSDNIDTRVVIDNETEKEYSYSVQEYAKNAFIKK